MAISGVNFQERRFLVIFVAQFFFTEIHNFHNELHKKRHYCRMHSLATYNLFLKKTHAAEITLLPRKLQFILARVINWVKLFCFSF